MEEREVLLGRDGEVAELRACVQQTRAHTQHVVVIDGPSGAGRSALLGRATDLAAHAGLPVTAVVADRSMTEVAGALAGALAPELTAATTATLPPPAVPTCLAVDDAHLADPESLRLLLQLVTQAAAAPLLVVLTAADGWAAPSAAAALDALRALPRTTLLRLAPLHPPDAAAVVGNRLGSDMTAAFGAACAAHAGGLPLLLCALADDLARRGVVGGDDERAEVTSWVPDRIRAVLSSRLAQLGDAPTAVAHAVAILGAQASLRHVRSLTGLERRAAEDAADALVSTRICCGEATLSFTEPIVAAAAEAAVEPFARQRRHRRAAELLAAEDGPLLRIGTHLCQTAPDGDRWSVEQLLAAARAVSATGDCRTAAILLTRALEEPPPADLLPAVLADLAFAESRDGSPEAPARIEGALAAVDDAASRVSLMREQTRLLWLSGQLPAAVRASERALAEAPPDSPVYEEVLAELLAVASMHDVATIGNYAPLAELLSRAGTGWVPDSAPLAATLATVVPLLLGDHRLISALADRAVTDDLWRLDAPPYGLRPDFVIGSLQFADQLDRAVELVEEGLGVASEHGDIVRIGLWNHWRASMYYQKGDLPTAIEAAVTSVDARVGKFMSWLGWATAIMANAHLDRGSPEAARAALDAAQGRLDGHQVAGIVADVARARLLTVDGEAQAALELVLDGGRRAEALSQHESPMIIWRPVAAFAAQAAGDRALARELAEAEVATARATHFAGRLGRALHVAALLGDDDDRLGRLEDACAMLAATPRELDHAGALVDLGIERHRVFGGHAAREALAEGRELAMRCGADPLAARALKALHATGARPRRIAVSGFAALTDAERQIVALAASGLTNREIGDQLVLAPRTVEWHLGRAYAKLGIRSRQELPGVLTH